MKIFITGQAREDIAYWNTNDRAKAQRIRSLIENIIQSPYSGIGKPEALKHGLHGKWSRRIDREHRLVYMISDDAVTILSCRVHYS